MAALAHFDHHQGGICKHVNFSSKSPNCKKFNTASLTIICARCSKDMDLQFAIIISRQVTLSTKSFIIANINMSESYGVFVKSVRILVIYMYSSYPEYCIGGKFSRGSVAADRKSLPFHRFNFHGRIHTYYALYNNCAY